jgi:hypothetical protein
MQNPLYDRRVWVLTWSLLTLSLVCGCAGLDLIDEVCSHANDLLQTTTHVDVMLLKLSHLHAIDLIDEACSNVLLVMG